MLCRIADILKKSPIYGVRMGYAKKNLERMIHLIHIHSKLEGQTFALFKLEEILKPMGYTIGGNWDYEKGCFDYKIDEEEGYQFLRLPFTAVEGELDVNGVIVRLDTPYLLSHVYQDELDDEVNTFTAGITSFDQFTEPKDPDGDIQAKYINIGKALVRELEAYLLNV